jgi:glycerophosphoryl diester phosphodiesterase
MKNIIYIIIASVAGWSCTQLKSEIKSDTKENAKPPITVVVHRGSHREAPENTFVAMKNAVEQGADYIEVDVATSSDGVFYCLHDNTLDRTTNGHGEISQRTSDYIDTLDAGSWFSPEFEGEGIPRVTELIKAFRGKTKFYFDIKDADIDQLITLIRMEKLENDCFVWFSDREKAKVFMEKTPDIAVKMNAKSAEDITTILQTYQPRIIETDVANITSEMQELCKQNNLKLMANLLRDSWWEYKQAIDLQIDMVNIDHPDYFRNMISAPGNEFHDYRLAAHRGGIVENVFNEFDPKSIQAAIDSGYWMLEIDVRPTKDKHIIVHHDNNLSRIYGVDKNVSDMTLQELKKLKATQGNYAPMTFEEVAQMCKGKIRFMMDLKPTSPEPWFCAEINRVLKKYNMLKSAYFIRNDVRMYFEAGKFGFRMSEAEAMWERLKAGEDIAAHYYLFDHGNRLNAEVTRWCQRYAIDVCASVNIGHYRMEDHAMGARRDILHLQDCGVTCFQIDSDYDEYFNLRPDM